MLLLFSFRSDFEMVKAKSRTRNSPDIVIITGLSGSGMTAATNTFEDLGDIAHATELRCQRAIEEAKRELSGAAITICPLPG